MIITLCGSTKFKEEFEKVNMGLSSLGLVVLSVVCFSHADNIQLTDDDKEIFDKVHLQKIDMSDAIFVIDVNGYIDDSTKNEISYARSKGKRIFYLSDTLKRYKYYPYEFEIQKR